MKKQDKTYMIVGVFVIFIISLGWASWQIKEGFKEGKGKRAERRAAKRAERAKARDPMWRAQQAANYAEQMRLTSGNGGGGRRLTSTPDGQQMGPQLSGDNPQPRIRRTTDPVELSTAMQDLYSQQDSSYQ